MLFLQKKIQKKSATVLKKAPAKATQVSKANSKKVPPDDSNKAKERIVKTKKAPAKDAPAEDTLTEDALAEDALATPKKLTSVLSFGDVEGGARGLHDVQQTPETTCRR